MLVTELCPTLCNPMEHSSQTPLSLEFSRQKYWSGLPFPSPGRCSISTQGSDPCHLHWQAGSLPMSHQGSPQISLCCVVLSCSAVSDSCDPMDYNSPGFSVHGDSPGKNTGVGCHILIQGIFLTQGSNPYLLWLVHCSPILYHWAN